MLIYTKIVSSTCSSLIVVANMKNSQKIQISFNYNVWVILVDSKVRMTNSLTVTFLLVYKSKGYELFNKCFDMIIK